MRSASLAGLLLMMGLLLAPHAVARELTPEELRRMPRPDAPSGAAEASAAEPLPPATAARELTPEELRGMPRPDALPGAAEASAAAPPASTRAPKTEPPPASASAPKAEPPPASASAPETELLPVTTRLWPRTGGLRGTLVLGALGEEPRWRMGLSGRPLPQLGWSVEAYHRIESPDVYGLWAAGAWRSAPWLLLEGRLGREVLGRDGADAELAALGALRLGSLTLFAGPAVGARLSSASHGVAGGAALLQYGTFTLRYDYRLRWTRVGQEGASHLLQFGWTSSQGLLLAARALRSEEPPDVRDGPRWLQEEVSALLDVPVSPVLALQLQALLGRRFEPSEPRPKLAHGGELGLALSF